MQPLNSTQIDSFLLDSAYINGQLFLLDAKVNLHIVGGNNLRTKQILKQPPTSALASWSAALKQDGEAVMLSKNSIRRFWFTKAASQERFTTTHCMPKLSAISDKFVATIDECGFLSIGSLLTNDLYFTASEIFSDPTALFFSSDSRWLFIGTRSNNSAFVYDLLTQKLIARFSTTKPVDGGIFVDGGRVLLTGVQKDLFFYSWHSKGAMLSHILLAKVRSKAMFVSDKFLFAGLSSGALAVLDLQKMEIVRVLEMLSQSVVFMKKCDSFVVVGGSDGALAIYDASKNSQEIAEAVKNGEFLRIKNYIEDNYFLLAHNGLANFLEEVWENSVFPAIVSLIENGESTRAKEVGENFLCDVSKGDLIKTLFSLKDQIVDLKKSIRSKAYDKADEILSIHTVLLATNSGKTYQKEWMDSFNRALDLLESNNQIEAKALLNDFSTVAKKAEAIENLINFPKPFIAAREKLNSNDIRGFFEDITRYPVLTAMPHYELILEKGKQLEKDLYNHALKHDYKNELATAKELMRYAPFALKARVEIDRLKIELQFQDYIHKSSFGSALDLASEHIYLLDSSAFVVLYAPYQKRLAYAGELAKKGEPDNLLTLLDEYLKNPLLKESALFLFRVAYTNEIRSIVMSSVINWANTFDNYTRLLGCDLLISSLAKELDKEGYLEPFKMRKNLMPPASDRLSDSVMNYDPINIPKPSSTTLEKVLFTAIAIVVLIVTTYIFISVIEKPMQEYKEEIKKETPYKLFENIAKDR